MTDVHVVAGAGPVGTTVALQLAEQGQRVRVLTRSGGGPEHPSIERRRVDMSRYDEVIPAVADAVAVYHCIHGSRYSARVWRAELPSTEQVVLAAAGRAGAVVVFPESLYSYGPVDRPMTEDLPRNARGGKLGVRSDLIRAREESETATVSVAASDFYGPLVRTAHAGQRMVPTILAGRTMRVVGGLDMPHSFTYVPDLGAAMITAAATPALWNSVLHAPTAPPRTQRQVIETFAAAAGVNVPRMSAIPGSLLRLVGTVSPAMRELAEIAYQFERPFVVNSSRSERLLGLSPTSWEIGATATVDWWRNSTLSATPA
jgi:nucleoside-diphosphate-sugar epimerase